jgi:hypothetical protein
MTEPTQDFGTVATPDRLLTESEVVMASKSPAPRDCGIYFLIKNDRVAYVGKSIDIAARLLSHRSRGFDRWHWIPCRPEELDLLERRYLDEFLPLWNADFQTAKKRGDLVFQSEPLPSGFHPLMGVDPGWFAPAEPEEPYWTQDDVWRERMRRLRAIKAGEARHVEDFGPMPQVGDLLSD